MKGQSTDQKPNKKLGLIRKATIKFDLKFQWRPRPIEKVMAKDELEKRKLWLKIQSQFII